MRVTYSELIQTSAKAFRGLHLPAGETKRAAHMVAELEILGFGGIKRFVDSLKWLDSHDFEIPSVDCLTPARFIHVNLKGSSLLPHLPMLLYCARENLLSEPLITLQLDNVLDPWFSLGEFLKVADRGASIHASWNDTDTGSTVMLIVNSGDENPCLFIRSWESTPESDNQFHSRHTLKIELRRKPFMEQKWTENMEGLYISSKELEKRRIDTMLNGAIIDKKHWDYLREMVDKTLVENSTESQRGAGGV